MNRPKIDDYVIYGDEHTENTIKYSNLAYDLDKYCNKLEKENTNLKLAVDKLYSKIDESFEQFREDFVQFQKDVEKAMEKKDE